MTTVLKPTTNDDRDNEHQNEDSISARPTVSTSLAYGHRQQVVVAIQWIYLVVGSLGIMGGWAVLRG